MWTIPRRAASQTTAAAAHPHETAAAARTPYWSTGTLDSRRRRRQRDRYRGSGDVRWGRRGPPPPLPPPPPPRTRADAVKERCGPRVARRRRQTGERDCRPAGFRMTPPFARYRRRRRSRFVNPLSSRDTLYRRRKSSRYSTRYFCCCCCCCRSIRERTRLVDVCVVCARRPTTPPPKSIYIHEHYTY